jgi:hypothetical protein
MSAFKKRWAKHCVHAIALSISAVLPHFSQAQGVGSVAILDLGKLLLIMTKAPLCNGRPVAMIVDRHGHKFDQTCEVTYSPGGISTRFSAESSPTNWPKERFESVRVQ